MKYNQVINFTQSNFKMIGFGKRTTIRLGVKSINIGPASLVCDGVGSIEVLVSEVRIVRFGDLGLLDAENDGFNSIEELRDELKRCYQTIISDYDVVTVIGFNTK